MTANEINGLLLFNGLTPPQLSLLLPLFVPEYNCEGSLLFHQGDQAEYLYILLEGEISIRFKPEDGPALTVSTVRPQGVVGWSAALGGPVYTSSAICATDCRMLRIRRRDLRTLCERDPETGAQILDRLADAIAERLRNTHSQVVALLQQGLRLPTRSDPITNGKTVPDPYNTIG